MKISTNHPVEGLISNGDQVLVEGKWKKKEGYFNAKRLYNKTKETDIELFYRKPNLDCRSTSHNKPQCLSDIMSNPYNRYTSNEYVIVAGAEVVNGNGE